MNKYFFLFLIIVSFLKTNGQTISGRILNVQTKKAIPFSTIYYDQTFIGISADQSGIFTIKKIKNQTIPLIISAIGYYSVILKDYSDKEYLEIALSPKTYEINEVSIKARSLERQRKRYLRIFKKEFIGTTKNAAECSVINENDITFNYNSSSDTIKAYALKPIIFENRAMGYTITYFLDKFEYSKKSNYTFFSGNFIFNKDWAEKSDSTTLYQTNRENSYYGSRTHFIRTLYSGKLLGTGFRIMDSSSYNLKISKVVLINKNQQHFFNSALGKIFIDYHGRISTLYLSGDPIYFNETGYYDPKGISWSGDMSNQRMADWLPYEYSPVQKQLILPALRIH